MFTEEAVRRVTENWPVYKCSKTKKRRGFGQRRKRHVNVKIKHLLKFEATKANYPILYPKES